MPENLFLAPGCNCTHYTPDCGEDFFLTVTAVGGA